MITLYIGKPDTLPAAEILDAAALGVSQIMEIINSVSLFGDTPTYRITGVDSSLELRSLFLTMVPEISKASSNVVVVLEKLLAAERKKIEPFATIYETKTKVFKKTSDTTNAFVLADAFATGDKKKIWITFQEKTTYDDEIEKTHGMVWWKIKDMMMKKGIFSSEDIKNMARNLVGVYHESRLGGLSMKDRLEMFFLTLPEVKK